MNEFEKFKIFLKENEIEQIFNINNAVLLSDEIIFSILILSDSILEKNSIQLCLNLIKLEMDRNNKPENLFRVNTISSKFITIFFKFLGLNYLIENFYNLINDICDKDLYLEIDPEAIKSNSNKDLNTDEIYQKNLSILNEYIQNIFNIIFNSYKFFPLELILILEEIKNVTEKKFTNFGIICVGN
jgi:hypothetical protein